MHLLNNPNYPVCMGMVHVTLVLIYCFSDELMGLIACITVMQSKDSQKIAEIHSTEYKYLVVFIVDHTMEPLQARTQMIQSNRN